MPKLTTNEHSVLEMALVGYELQRNRIESAIAEIQAELVQGDSSRAISPATAGPEPKTTGNKRFSASARKRMAAAREKRWQLLKANKTKPTVAAKRRKATVAAPARKRPVQVKAAKPKTRKSAPAVRKAVAKPEVQNPVPPAQAAEVTPAEATA